jgi:hypothetical protein
MSQYIKGRKLEITGGVVIVYEGSGPVEAVARTAVSTVIATALMGPLGLILGPAISAGVGIAGRGKIAIPLDRVESIDMKSNTVYLKD